MALSAFPYPGGKTPYWKRIVPHFPSHHTYVEPFGGSAAVLLNEEPSYAEVFDDVDGDIVHFFETLREQRDEFVDWLQHVPYSRDIFEEWADGYWAGERPEDAVLDEVERDLTGRQANLVYQFVEIVHTNLRAYAQRQGYDVESTIDSLQQPEVERSGNTIIVRVGWASEQMARWEFGTSDHSVQPVNADVLSFVWEDPPGWVREEFDQARSSGGQFRSGYRVFLPEVEVSGLPESRAIRDGINALRRVLQG